MAATDLPAAEPAAPIVTRRVADDREADRWPSARAILQAQPVRKRSNAAGARRASRRALLQKPTERRSPDQWTIPFGSWFCVPLALASLAGGLGGVVLAWRWAVAAEVAGPIADRLAAGARPGEELTRALAEEEMTLPPPSWRNSEADGLIVRAALVAGAADAGDPVAGDRAGALLAAARQSAPADASLRFAVAWRAAQEPEPAVPGLLLGLSRDVVPLTLTARSLLTAGKRDEAARAYQTALDLAGRADPPAEAPAYHDRVGIRRFGLPGEELIALVVADMADRGEWSFDDWRAFLPGSAPVALAVARVLRERNDPAAAEALELAIERAEAPPAPGVAPALHEAAAAEALALAGRREEAAERYRKALALRPDRGGDDPVRRSWWFNLSTLCGEVGDTAGERSARLASMTTDPRDPITYQAIEANRRSGLDLLDGSTATAATDRP